MTSMVWIVHASLCSLFNALQGAWIKKLLGRMDRWVVTWAAFAFSFPPLLVLLLIGGIPDIAPSFWPAFGVGLVLNLAAFTLYVKGIELSPLSSTIPFLSFTPLFLILTSWLILGETPQPLGIAGILFIVIGAYVINLDQLPQGPLSPFRNIYREKGSLAMLFVALIWSITANIDKICVLSSSPTFYLTVFYLSFPFLYLPLTLTRAKSKLSQLKANFVSLCILGVLGASLVLFQMLAIRIALVSYVIGIKRAGMLFSIVLGFLFFGERNLRFRFLGAALMLAGVACIVLS